MTMETSQPLATESFSYSWLSNGELTLDGLDIRFRASLDSSHETTSKELDYKMNSKKYSEETQNFDFNIPKSQSSSLVYADELFCSGIIKPVFVNPSSIEVSNDSNNNPVIPFSTSSSRTLIPAFPVNCHFLRRWKRPSGRILWKCFGYLRPLCHRVRGSRNCTRVRATENLEVKSWSNSPQASPEPSIVYATSSWCDMESSICEAVLHCKRSIEK